MQDKGKHSNRLWTAPRIAATVLVLSLFAAFGVSSCNSTDEKPANRAATQPARRSNAPAAPAVLTTLPPAVTDAELPAVTGSPFKLSTYSGKVLVVNLWATWCGPCRLETPELIKLYNEYRSQGVEVVGLTTEFPPETSSEKVKRFVQDYDIPYRVGWATRDVALTLMQGHDAIPQSFVIGRDGRILKRFVGFNNSSTPALMKEAIQDALNGKSTAD